MIIILKQQQHSTMHSILNLKLEFTVSSEIQYLIQNIVDEMQYSTSFQNASNSLCYNTRIIKFQYTFSLPAYWTMNSIYFEVHYFVLLLAYLWRVYYYFFFFHFIYIILKRENKRKFIVPINDARIIELVVLHKQLKLLSKIMNTKTKWFAWIYLNEIIKMIRQHSAYTHSITSLYVV